MQQGPMKAQHGVVVFALNMGSETMLSANTTTPYCALVKLVS
jgi:hypothetical protein